MAIFDKWFAIIPETMQDMDEVVTPGAIFSDLERPIAAQTTASVHECDILCYKYVIMLAGGQLHRSCVYSQYL